MHHIASLYFPFFVGGGGGGGLNYIKVLKNADQV